MHGCRPLLLALACAALALGAAGGCRSGALGGPGAAPKHSASRPARRTFGPRLPNAFGGHDPAALGLRKVEGLVWLTEADLPAWRPGGAGVLADPSAGPGAGLTLRTDHVLLHTDLSAAQALPLARLAQGQVEALLAVYGEALDLRLPSAPLVVTVIARRADFERALVARLGESSSWNAFYDAEDATVRVCAEPSARAPLPLASDVKHELTHAVLDLGAPRDVPHGRIVEGLHFWLWEAVAVHAEGLGEPGGGLAFPIREARFRQRLARAEVPPLAEFLRLPQQRFEGRHYDMAAVLMRFLLADPILAPRTLDLLRRLLGGDLLVNDPAREWGLPVAEVERRWRAWLARGGRP